MTNANFEMFIVATPIGNLNDISKRAIETLNNSDLIICENPKHSLKLLNKLGIKKKLVSLHDYNENLVIKRLSNDLMNKKLALISDAGSPLISDPGYKLIQFCIKNGAKVHSIPGPNSIIPALQLSGIPIDEFYFAGFLPKTDKHINDFIDKIKNINLTSVFFVSSHKLKNCLVSLENKLPDRSISISKELTKINEKTFRCIGSEINESVSINAENLKGEFVVVVGKNSMKKTESSNLEDYNEEIIKLLIKFSLTDVVEIVHKLTGITKNKIYKWALDLKKK